MAAHKLPRLSKSILDTPQLITESKFREIAEVLENRDSSVIQASLFTRDDGNTTVGEESKGFGEEVGVLTVEGPLTYKPTGWEALCGEGCNYVGLMEQTDTLVESGVKTIVMKLDTPGGQAFRCFSTAKYIRNKCDEKGIKLIGYVDGQACSGGMALGSACHELIANPDSSIGSVGVVISLTSTSERDKKEGIKREFITAGKSKVPYDEEGNFKAEFKEDLQNKINKTYNTFVKHVADMRGIDEQVVRDTEAKVFDAEDALSVKFIDSVMEEDDFKEYIGASDFITASQIRHHNDDEKMNVASATNLNTEEKAHMTDTLNPEQLAALQSQLEEMKAQNEAQAEALAKFQEKELAVEKATLVEKLESVSFLANFEGLDAVASFLMSADDANKQLMNSVIEAAKLENEKVVEEAATQIAEKQEELSAANEAVEAAKLEVENAKAEALAVKEEFGKGDAIEGVVKDKTVTADATSGKARTAQLAALVKQKQANK